MQQAKNRLSESIQSDAADSGITKGDTAQQSKTKIEAISTSGNLKVSLKATRAQNKKNQPSVTAKSTTAQTHSQAKSQQSGAGNPPVLTDQMVDKPQVVFSTPASPAQIKPSVKIAGGLAAVLTLAVIAMSLFPGQKDTIPAQVAEVEPTSAPVISDELLNLVAAASAAGAAEQAVNQGDTLAGTNVSTQSAATDDMISKMTAGTIAALRAKKPEPAAPQTAPTADAAAVSAIYALVMSAHAQGQSEAYIDQLLNEAHARNDIAVPTGLIGADGRVDTRTILSLFIAK